MTPDNEDVFGFGSKILAANNGAGPGALTLSMFSTLFKGSSVTTITITSYYSIHSSLTELLVEKSFMQRVADL